MTPLKSIIPTTLAVTALAGILVLSGCAGTNETGGKGMQALVCPQCKMVAMTGNRPSGYEYRGGHEAHDESMRTVYNDTCPGCQGAIKTLLVNGRTKYECSICKGSPYTCPVSHPMN